MSEINKQELRRSRRSMLMLALFFIAPVLVAWIVLSNYSSLGSSKTKNYGELITPARPLRDFSLQTSQAKPFGIQELQGKWTMVYFDDGQCQASCEQDLYMARQSRLSQNEEVQRVARLLVLSAAPSPHLQQILTHHEDLTVVHGTAESVAALQKQFVTENSPTVLHQLYLVDPLGNLMMFYASGFNPKGLIKDLQHLLKWSQIG